MTALALCMSPGKERDALAAMLGHIFDGFCAEVSILPFSCAAELFAALPSRDMGMMLFHTELADMPGLTAARHIRSLGYDGPLLFVSASGREVLASYGVHAAGFFVHPVQYSELQAVLRRVRGAFAKSLRSIQIVSDRIERSIHLMDILYVEASGHASILHTLWGPLPTGRSIAQLEAQLAGEPFLRCHRSYLVNRALIARAGREGLTLAEGSTVQISANRAGEIEKALAGMPSIQWEK